MLACTLLAAGAASAQTGSGGPWAKVLGKDDEEFARNLSRFGYADLADIVLGAIEESGAGKSSLQGELLRLEFEQDRAQREPDLLRRIELLDESIRSRENFAKTHPAAPETGELLDRQLELYRSVGELIARALVENPASPENARLKKRGVEILEQAVTTLEARLAVLAQPAEAALTPEQEEARTLEHMIASYGLARTLYFRALLGGEGSVERTLAARKALSVLLDFQLEYPDQLLCYEGFIYEGLCHVAIDEKEKALESFDAAIALRETYEQNSAGIWLMAPEAADIVSSAVQQKMLLLAGSGDQAGAAAVAQDFVETTGEPWKALKGLAVLSLQADAYQALGDREALDRVAKTLMEVDPFGPGGARGRELLGSSASGGSSALGAVEVLKLAESAAGREPERATELAQRVMILARGTVDEDNLGSRAGLLVGALYAQRGLLHESVVAWEGAAQRYPDGKDAPECLWRSINGYLALQGQERRPIYKTLAEERLEELSTRYPQHPYASMAGLIEGQEAEAEQDFARAAQIYERIPAGSAGHEEGLYRAGNAWSRQARKLLGESKKAEAADAVKRAEALLVKARTELDAALSKTLETSAQERLRGFSFSSRVALANLWMLEGVDRASEVAGLFQGIDQELARDPVRMGTVWDLRFRALRAQGKLDEALALFDKQIAQDPSAAWLETGAGALAPLLDKRGQDLLRTEPRSSEIDKLWGKAASYYQLAIAAQLSGRASVQIEQVEGVADRLFVFGLRLEGVPDTVETFAEWDGKPLTNAMLERAAQAYETVLPLTPSHRTVIKLARTLGFLGRWEEAAARYAELFERENFVDRVTNGIRQSVVAAKPELLFGYLEWGVAEREVGVATDDTSKLLRASKIFEALVVGTNQGGKLWWQAKYRQLQTMVDRGEYELADISIKSLQLNWEHFDDGQYGMESRIGELRSRLSSKVFR